MRRSPPTSVTARTTDTPYDLVLIGNATATEPTATTIPQYERAGVTWLLTQALTVADARDRNSNGRHETREEETRHE